MSDCEYTFDPRSVEETSIDGEWRCPHDAYDGAERCVFHLEDARREALGVDGGTVRRAFTTAVDTEGRRAKEFVGARFEDLDLSYAILDAPDRYPLDLRHAHVESFELSNGAVHQPIDMRHATVGTIEWTDAEFADEVRLDRSTVRGTISAEGVRVTDDFDIRGTVFDGEVVFDEARFGGDTCFKETRFRGPAWFRGVEFRGDANLLDDDACFEDGVFEGPVAFTKAQFRYADFVDVSFEGDAEFEEATFEGDAEFDDATFEERALFRGAEFDGDANVRIDDAGFSGVRFGGEATFYGAQFRKAVFARASFEDDATFADAVFEGEVSFTAATFDADAAFDEGRFYDDTAFDETTFHGDLSIRGAEFHGGDNVDDEDLTFAGASVAGTFDAERAEFSYATFAHAAFGGPAEFGHTSFGDTTVFTDAHFDAEARFPEVRFHSDTAFDRCTFEARAQFPGTEFEGDDYIETEDVTFAHTTFEGPLDFRNCRFNHANFAQVTARGIADFAGARFALDADLSRSRWERGVSFPEARFHEDVNFARVTFEDDATFRGAEFHGGANTEEDDLDFTDATFDGDADFYEAQFRYATFEGASFGDRARFTGTVFDDDARFGESRFAGEAIFDEVRFDDDATFDGAEFDRSARFRGVEFHGGANMLDDDADFQGVTFHEDVTFERGVFGYTDFSEAVFEGDAVFARVQFTDRTDFGEITVHGDAQFDMASFARTAVFRDATFDGSTQFDQARFESNVSFVDAAFERDVEFTGTAFEGSPTVLSDDADFSRTTFEGAAAFDEAEFRYANFTETTFRGDTSLDRTVYDQGAEFDGSEFGGEFSMCHARFEGETSLVNVAFDAAATFEGTRFLQGSNSRTEAVSFDDSVFRSEAAFRDCEFNTARFRDTAFAVGPVFVGAVFDESVTFRAVPVEGDLLVDMSGAELAGGRIVQPADGSTFFDFTGTTVRDISLEPNDSEFELLDHFLFVETHFDGFDFSEHMDVLNRNDWEIHDFRYRDPADGEESGVALTPATLERTYLLAKNSANEDGHRKAAAEFYIKEFSYRGKKNAELFRESTADLGSRLKAGGKWFGNWLLYETCGYGERLWRIIYISALVIGTWALLYATVTQGTRGPGDLTTRGVDSVAGLFTSEGLVILGRTLYFSLVTFTTLGYGDVQPIGAVARTLAGLESFLGALLVALVVFVIGRRMA